MYFQYGDLLLDKPHRQEYHSETTHRLLARNYRSATTKWGSMPDDSQSFNSFQPVAPSTYDPENFYTRATDHRGHSKTWRHGPGSQVTNIPPELHSMMAVLREEYAEYTSNADIMRDALVHLAHLREEQRKNPSPRMTATLRFAKSYAELERLRSQVEAQEKALLEIESAFQNSRDIQTRTHVVGIVSGLALDASSDDFRQRLEALILRYS